MMRTKFALFPTSNWLPDSFDARTSSPYFQPPKVPRTFGASRILVFIEYYFLSQVIKIPNIVNPALIEIRLMADHENRALVGFESSFKFIFGIHI